MNKISEAQAAYEVIVALENAGYEAVFVGGAVRDKLLGLPKKDVDIATDAEPHEVKKVFSNTVDVGIAHGTILVIHNGVPIEVTTYRTEGTYTDHRRPDQVEFVKSLREDLQRRDFTMNAIAMEKDGKVIDPFNGQEDLKSQLIRAVGNPDERFHEDALRMLRAVRFSAVLGFTIEQETLQAIRNNAGKLAFISVERIKTELDKLFVAPFAQRGIENIINSELAHALPTFPEENMHAVLSAVLPAQSTLEGWAMFGLCCEMDAQEIGRLYKLSNAEKKLIHEAAEAFATREQGEFDRDSYYRFSVESLYVAEKMYQALNQLEVPVSIDEISRKKNALPISTSKDLKVTGSDLIAWTGQRGGPWLGEWLGKIERAVLYGHCNNDPNLIKEWFLHEFNRQE